MPTFATRGFSVHRLHPKLQGLPTRHRRPPVVLPRGASRSMDPAGALPPDAAAPDAEAGTGSPSRRPERHTAVVMVNSDHHSVNQVSDALAHELAAQELGEPRTERAPASRVLRNVARCVRCDIKPPPWPFTCRSPVARTSCAAASRCAHVPQGLYPPHVRRGEVLQSFAVSSTSYSALQIRWHSSFARGSGAAI